MITNSPKLESRTFIADRIVDRNCGSWLSSSRPEIATKFPILLKRGPTVRSATIRRGSDNRKRMCGVKSRRNGLATVPGHTKPCIADNASKGAQVASARMIARTVTARDSEISMRSTRKMARYDAPPCICESSGIGGAVSLLTLTRWFLLSAFELDNQKGALWCRFFGRQVR